MRTPSRLLRGYGPLLAFVVVFLLMAVLVPTVDKEVVTGQASATGTSTGDGLSTGTGSASGDGTGVTTGDRTGGPDGSTTGDPGGPGVGETPTGQPPATSGCPDRDLQIPGDPYSPPCVAFEGDNGGATSQGVTADEVIVSVRLLDEPGFDQTLARLAGADILDQPRDIERTITALAAYLNKRFEFYGRTLKPVFYKGAGAEVPELLGGGQAEAEADAVRVDEEIQAFAEVNGATPPFTDALARRQVIAFGTPYLSREWHMDRNPYNWSLSTDCSIITESTVEFGVKHLYDKNAEFAGPGLQGKPRTSGVLAPENPWYQQCVDAGEKSVQAAGYDFDLRIDYKLDIATMSNQAASVISKLKSQGITTVICGCDPIFPVFLSAKAAEQNYHPEWVITGSADTDLDVVGQLMDQDQWSRAFGVSYKGTFRPMRAGLGYAAYKTERQDEPAFTVEEIYSTMYMIALGIQLAGPNLTPETFEQGMFSYPGGSGPYGTWGFGPRNYTPAQDFRIVWWDPDRLSPFNNKRGTYVEAFDGQRFRSGEVADTDPGLFRE